MTIGARELYCKGLISRNVLYIEGKAYKIVAYDYENDEFQLVEAGKPGMDNLSM